MFVKFLLVKDVVKPYFAFKTCKFASNCLAKLTSKAWNDSEEFRMIYQMEEEGLSVRTTPQLFSESLDKVFNGENTKLF